MEENENIINEATPVEEKAVEQTPVMETPKEEAPAKKAPKAPRPKPVPAEDFDWTSSHKKFDNYSADERAKLEERYAGTMSQVADHEVIEGTVVAITDREVVVNIGFKSDGVIPVAEFRTNPNLKVGDKVEVYVENQEGPNGQLILSHKKAQLLKSWDRVNEAYESGEIVNGYVKSRTKGGLIVEVFGLEAFLPGSQIDVKPIRDYDVFVDSVMEFKVVKINQE
nr:S1 RNA-binding domain-containing protein [Bacteroidales bacterium]